MSETDNIVAPISWAARIDGEGVADHIASIIGQPGDHWLAVPGGKTPLPTLTQDKEVMLVMRGCDKKRVLDETIAGQEKGAHDLPPTRHFNTAHCPITIFWSRP